MIIRPGSIVPINFDLWPAKSGQLIMAMVLACEDQWFNLCPVHCEPKLAGFNDLVVMPNDSSLNMFMVVMGKLAAGFPASAISPEVFAATQSPRIQALEIPESECERLRKQTFAAVAASSPETSCQVHRGNFIPPGSPSARKLKKLTEAWTSFNKASWQKEFAARHLVKEINIDYIINELSLPLEAMVKELTPPELPKPERRRGGISTTSRMSSVSEIEPEAKNQRSSSKKRECAGRLGSLLGRFNPEPEEYNLESLRKKLKALLTGTKLDTPITRQLLQGPLTDLLKLLLQLFPR